MQTAEQMTCQTARGIAMVRLIAKYAAEFLRDGGTDQAFDFP
jgi:hypothetical protein